MKVETHNHPTAISPFPGAATGAGGEIRDEGATGRGAKTQGGADRVLGVQSRHSGVRAAVGTDRLRPAAAHGVGAADHDRRPDRRRVVQQRIRTPESRRLFPHLRAAGGGGDARLPQADHDRRRPRQHRGAPCVQESAGRRRAADPAGRARAADRARRRRGVQHGYRRQPGRPRFRLGAARQRRDRAPRAGGDRPLLGAGRGQSHSVDPRCRRRRPVERAAGDRAFGAGAAGVSICARCRAKSRACRRCRSGATRRRSATCWRSRRRTSRVLPRSASASAVRSRWSGRRPTTASSR